LIFKGSHGEGFIMPWDFLGKNPGGSKGLNTYETKIIEEQVYVKVEEKIYYW